MRMAKAQIVTVPNKILTQKTKKVKVIDDEVRALAQTLIDTLNNAKEPEGAGIAATQIGNSNRVCVVRRFFESPTIPHGFDYEDMILINPEIVSKSKETDVDWEGCLSIPDVYGEVRRHTKVKVKSLTLSGNEITFTAEDFFARVVQHEIDHLDGVLFTSRVTGKTISEKELDKILQNAVGKSNG